MKLATTKISGILAVVVSTLVVSHTLARAGFLTFESGPVRPLALSADGTELYAVNMPDGRLEVFRVSAAGLEPLASIPVGMEPVAVAARGNGEVWVVNHLSDSVSIVDPALGRVVRTLLVGDEPRDIVFAGPGFSRAFITTAHRGQQRVNPALAGVPGAGDPELTTPGVGRADVWVFDADDPGGDVGGVPLRIIELFGDTPRALASSPDGATVYAAVLSSGNQTSVLNDNFVCDGFQAFTPCVIGGLVPAPGGVPGPPYNHQFEPAPEVGLIVKYQPSLDRWVDVIGRDWTFFVRFDLPDQDVFRIDASTLQETAAFSGVGTTLFNMVVHPTNGKVYVSNTESENLTRFEGPGEFTSSTVQGHLAESRITVIDGSSVLPRHLNKHIDYATLASGKKFDPSTRFHSLATPLDMAITSNGSKLYVAAFGSSKIGVFSTAALDTNTFDPRTASAGYIHVSGGGPAGLALDEPRGRLYVWTRFDNGISTVDLANAIEIGHTTFHSSEPPGVRSGRRFLYDAFATSANGEASCASCHIFGDLDQLAWDLGDPDGDVTTNPINILNPAAAAASATPINGTGEITDFHPMKGPMTTQTLRGLANHGAMHWRGDRANGFFGVDATDEDLSFRNFIVAFEGLLGREAPIAEADMQKFADFALTLTLPPNPVRALDNSLTSAQQAGRNFWFNTVVDGPRTCNGCHTLDPALGFFGTGTDSTFEGNSQIFKVPHLRNAYTKVGMFGMLAPFGGGVGHLGAQVRGFGVSHNGSVDTLFRFVSAQVFNFPNETSRRDMEQFVLAFDNDVAPIVGQQVTLSSDNLAAATPRVDLLLARASAPFVSLTLGGATTECEVVVKGTVGGVPRGWLRLSNGRFQADDDPGATATLSDAELRALASSEGPLTYTCVPPGSGERIAINRDEDAFLDGVDNCPSAPNDDQADLDGDDVGDACDPQSCGDGVVGALEQCDDGGTDDGDGCSAACEREAGFACEGAPSACFIDVPIDAKSLKLKKSSKDTLTFSAKDPDLPFPVIGGADDPANGTPGGMTIELISPDEGIGLITVPPGESLPPGWKIKDASFDSYTYKNPTAPLGPSTVKTAMLKQGKLIKISGRSVPLAMERPLISVAIRITTGRLRTCALFQGASVADTEAGRFTGKNALAGAIPNCSNQSLGAP